jgi:hypothetical protein
MSNTVKNRGRILNKELRLFASYLIEEALDISGLNYFELDEKLDIPGGQSYRYSKGLCTKKGRAPQLGSIQNLENRVAKLLKRPAHIVAILNHSDSNLIIESTSEIIVGLPVPGVNLRDLNGQILSFGYDDNWPTYRRLKYAPVRQNISTLSLYAWQWGILWDRDVLPEPWRRECHDLSMDAPIEPLIASIMQTFMNERKVVFECCE